jgi:hypothetical protein
MPTNYNKIKFEINNVKLIINKFEANFKWINEKRTKS